MLRFNQFWWLYFMCMGTMCKICLYGGTVSSRGGNMQRKYYIQKFGR